jgi:hypothetical protein
MRMQLSRLLGLTVALAATFPRGASADGDLAVRGVYYKERSTRVIQPMLDAMFEVGSHGLLTSHFLVDAITSASSAAGAVATPFTEKRYEAGVGYSQEIDRFKVGGDTKYSTESDYRSFYLGGRGEMELAQKNAVIGLGGGLSLDRVSNAGAQSPMGGPMLVCDNAKPQNVAPDCPLRVLSLFASASQIVSRDALVAISYDASKDNGFLSNPYRIVIADDGMTPERHPNDRTRQAVAVSGRYYLTATDTTFVGAYRLYHDSWKITAHTPELRIIQQAGRDIDASIRYRYYRQSAAFFYEKRYPSIDPGVREYETDDPKMSAFDGHTFEAKLGFLGEALSFDGLWAGARFEGILEYVIQHNSFGNAIIAHAALTVPFSY